MKTASISMLLLSLFFLTSETQGAHGPPSNETEFALVNPGPDPIIQGDPYGTLSFTVDRTSGNNRINKVRFTFPSALYEVSAATQGPQDWIVTLGPALTPPLEKNVVEFYCPVSGSQISNKTLRFSMIVTGINGGTIPNAAADDNSHYLSSVEAWDDDGDSCPYDGAPVSSFPWLRQGLFTQLNIVPDTMPLEAEATFYLSVQNRTTAQQTVTPITPTRLVDGRRVGELTYVSGPVPSNQTFLSGETKEFVYKYRATRLRSTRYVSGGTGSGVTSNECISNEVVIGDVGGQMVVPLTAANNEAITLAFHVTNNTDHPLTNLRPMGISWSGKNGLNKPVLIDGPTPPGPVPSLAPDSEIVFYWVYRVSGDPGAQYLFSGRVLSDQEDTVRDQSDWGTIEVFSVRLDPLIVSCGDTEVQFNFWIQNGGSTSDYINQVTIMHPDANFQQSPPYFIGASGGNASSWDPSPTPDGKGIIFTPTSTGDVLYGTKGMTLSMKYNIPDKTIYPNETLLTFPVILEGRVSGSSYTTNKLPSFRIINYSLEVQMVPPPPTSPPYLSADGSTQLMVNARLMQNDVPVANDEIDFTAEYDKYANLLIPPNITPISSVTDLTGHAFSTFTAPRYEQQSPSEISVNVVAYFPRKNMTARYDHIRFTYCDKPSFKVKLLEVKQRKHVYEPVSEVELIPGSVSTVQFRVTITVFGASQIINILRNTSKGATTITFTDKENNGQSNYTAYLSTDYHNIHGYNPPAY
ncbi:MAG: hypothetical protein JW774_03915, partial [Candidatus Aureabacteria bacterium]|nr:hypothetical protein [Candidatus Auribacterota bacterium]